MCIHPPVENSENFVLEIFRRAAKPVLFIQGDDTKRRTAFVEDVMNTLRDAKDFPAAKVIKLDADALLSADIHGIAAQKFRSAVNLLARLGGGVVHLSNFNEASAARVNASEVVAQLLSDVTRTANVRFVVSGEEKPIYSQFLQRNPTLARRAVTMTVGA